VKKSKTPKFGVDVTEEFERAADLDFRVYRKEDGTYCVVDTDEPTRPMGGAEQLRDEKRVHRFLGAYRGG
jgi:hypothetical protein